MQERFYGVFYSLDADEFDTVGENSLHIIFRNDDTLKAQLRGFLNPFFSI